jgi:hypothetical protein
MSTGLVMVGLVDGLLVSIQKKKTKMEKTNYKIMERITLAWGKHKNGKNQLQKAGQTGEQIGKHKNKCRCVRECRFGGSFFYSFGTERKSSSSSSRT